MRPAIQALVVALIFATCGGLIFPFILKVREEGHRIECGNNLHQLAIALANYDSANDRYPAAAIPNPDLPPEKRLSWLVAAMPFIEADPTYRDMDLKKGWDAEENRFAALTMFKRFHCPNYAEGPPVSTLWPSHYIGIAGVGENAADLPSHDPQAGCFGYERKLWSKDLIRGASQIAVATETSAAQGAWTAAGAATVRGYDPATSHFGGNHRAGCQVVFMDGSVRIIDAKMSEKEWARLVVLRDEAAQE
jgi:hypothetical protein